MASTSIQEQDSSVIPTSLFLLSSLLLVSAASENNSVLAKDKEGEGEEGKERVGDVGEEGNVGNVGEGEGDAGKKGQKSGVTFDLKPAQGTSTGQSSAQGPSTGQGQSPSTGQYSEEEYSNLIAAITQQYMRTYNHISLELRSLDTIFKYNVNNLEKLNHHLEDFGININKVTNNICINFTSKKKAINIKAKYTARLTTKLEKLMDLRDKTSILTTIDEAIDTITNINDLNAVLKPYAIRLSYNQICIKRKTSQDEANEEDDKAEAIAAVEAAIEVGAEEARAAKEVANERAKAEQAKAEQARLANEAAERAKANEAAERAKANEAEEAARTIQRRIRRRTSTHKLGSPLRKALSAKSRNSD